MPGDKCLKEVTYCSYKRISKFLVSGSAGRVDYIDYRVGVFQSLPSYCLRH